MVDRGSSCPTNSLLSRARVWQGGDASQFHRNCATLGCRPGEAKQICSCGTKNAPLPSECPKCRTGVCVKVSQATGPRLWEDVLTGEAREGAERCADAEYCGIGVPRSQGGDVFPHGRTHWGLFERRGGLRIPAEGGAAILVLVRVDGGAGKKRKKWEVTGDCLLLRWETCL